LTKLSTDAYVKFIDKQHPSIMYRMKLLDVFIDRFTDGCSHMHLSTDVVRR